MELNATPVFIFHTPLDIGSSNSILHPFFLLICTLISLKLLNQITPRGNPPLTKITN